MSKKESRIGIVVGTPSHAHDLQRQLDPKRREFFVLHPGMEFRGLRFEFLLVTDSYYHEAYYAGRERGRDMGRWLDELAAICNHKGGRVVRL